MFHPYTDNRLHNHDFTRERIELTGLRKLTCHQTDQDSWSHPEGDCCECCQYTWHHLARKIFKIEEELKGKQ